MGFSWCGGICCCTVLPAQKKCREEQEEAEAAAARLFAAARLLFPLWPASIPTGACFASRALLSLLIRLDVQSVDFLFGPGHRRQEH